MSLLSRRALLASLMPQQPTAPNILFIMSDDHASHAISAYGGKLNSTPNIDRLAREGVRLDNCFCTNSICTPSRAAILTGQYSHRNGVYTLNDQLDSKRTTVATRLQSFGYQTAMIGKWHLGTTPQGFDHWKILPGQGVYNDPVFLDASGRQQYPGYCTDLITDFTLDFLKARDQTRPFFLMCHHKAPHRPWDPALKYKDLFNDRDIPEPSNLHQQIGRGIKMRVPEDLTERDLKTKLPVEPQQAYQRFIKDYLRCIQSVDDSVGRILDQLDKDNLRDNTLVIYTSDQGFFLGDHGLFDKRLMYEESLRMPLLARYPKEIKPNSRNTDMSLNIDFAPTFLDYAGMGRDPAMQGESMRQNLQGRTPETWRQSIYYRYWMHDDSEHHVPGHYGIRTKTQKLIRYQTTLPEYELFDLKSDPHEMKNLAPSQPSQVSKLKSELTRLQHKYGDKPFELQ